MNFVVVKHPKCSQLYLFRLPENIIMSPFIEVKCDTRFGDVEGITVTPSFVAPEEAVDKLCELYGTRRDCLRFVKAVVEKKEIELDDEETLAALAEQTQEQKSKAEEADEEDDEDEETPEEKLAALGHMLVHVFGDKEEKK